MALQQNPKVRARNYLQNLAEGADQPLAVNPRAEALVVQAQPPNAELVRLAYSWYVIQSTAVSPVTSLPTTTGQIGIYNNEPATGKVYVIDSVFGVVTTSAGAGVNIGIAAGIWSATQSPSVPSSAGLTVRGLSGRAYSYNAVIGVGITTPSGVWTPLGSSVVDSNTADAMLAVDIPVNGSFVVLPGGLFAISMLCSTATTIVGVCGFRWHEILTPFN
jgi:hypothetical protein